MHKHVPKLFKYSLTDSNAAIRTDNKYYTESKIMNKSFNEQNKFSQRL